jgi:hypothetical protein
MYLFYGLNGLIHNTHFPPHAIDLHECDDIHPLVVGVCPPSLLVVYSRALYIYKSNNLFHAIHLFRSSPVQPDPDPDRIHLSIDRSIYLSPGRRCRYRASGLGPWLVAAPSLMEPSQTDDHHRQEGRGHRRPRASWDTESACIRTYVRT